MSALESMANRYREAASVLARAEERVLAAQAELKDAEDYLSQARVVSSRALGDLRNMAASDDADRCRWVVP